MYQDNEDDLLFQFLFHSIYKTAETKTCEQRKVVN